MNLPSRRRNSGKKWKRFWRDDPRCFCPETAAPWIIELLSENENSLPAKTAPREKVIIAERKAVKGSSTGEFPDPPPFAHISHCRRLTDRNSSRISCPVLVIAPVTLRNYIVGHDVVLMTSNGGLNLYIGNNENADGVYNPVTELRMVGADPESDWTKPLRIRVNDFVTRAVESSWVHNHLDKGAQ